MVLGFNDLPDEMIELIIDHTQPGFDHRSRTLAQNKCRELLDTHKHDSLVTERILPQLVTLPTDHLKYYTFLQKLTKFLSPIQLLDIANSPISERIRQMAVIAQENQDYSLFKIIIEFAQIEPGDDEALMLSRF